jgi:hypothetical protein
MAAASVGSVDLGALLRTLQTTGVQLPPTLGVQAPAVKPKKKAATVEEKDEKAILTILDGKDTFRLKYNDLLIRLDEATLNEKVTRVRVKYNRP